MPAAAIGEIVWYVSGRFYASADAASVADYGYFLHLAGVDDPLFDGPVGESAARLTFAARPFAPGSVANGSLAIGLDPVGEFSIYLQERTQANFDAPLSFARGERIATFRRVGMVVGTTLEQAGSAPSPLFASNVFSARLLDSRPFRLGAGRYDFRDIVGAGITQFGLASGSSVPPPQGYRSAVPFTGSAIRLG